MCLAQQQRLRMHSTTTFLLFAKTSEAPNSEPFNCSANLPPPHPLCFIYSLPPAPAAFFFMSGAMTAYSSWKGKVREVKLVSHLWDIRCKTGEGMGT